LWFEVTYDRSLELRFRENWQSAVFLTIPSCVYITPKRTRLALSDHLVSKFLLLLGRFFPLSLFELLKSVLEHHFVDGV
jgi:hypothetical protein